MGSLQCFCQSTYHPTLTLSKLVVTSLTGQALYGIGFALLYSKSNNGHKLGVQKLCND